MFSNRFPSLRALARHGRVALVWAAVLGVTPEMPGAWAQDDGADGADGARPAADAGKAAWTKIEQEAEKAYREPIRSGGGFEAGLRDFAVKKAVPQLAVESNRPIVDRVRRRLREILLVGISDDRSFEEASKAVAEAALVIARDSEASMPARVNAMLLVGDLRAKDGKEGTVWSPAAAPLAAAAADASLAPAVRVAALSGLTRHAEAARRAGGDKLGDFAKAARPAVLAIVAEPASEVDPVVSDWLASRALALVTSVMKSAPKDFAAALEKLMGDQRRSLDVRVRAAAALGATVTPKSEIQPVETVGAIQNLAVAVLEADEGILRDRRYEQQLSGGPSAGGAGGPPGTGKMGMMAAAMMSAGGPGGAAAAPALPQLVPDQALRRTAWRLASLADALLTEDGKAGVATLLSGEDKDNTKLYADLYREQALKIDEARTDDSLLEAIAMVRPEEEAEAAPVEGTATAPQDAPAATAPDNDPFSGK